MGVEAARAALRSAAGAAPPERILFATANPPYLDKTNAAVIHAALDLPASALALDFGGAVRSGVGALLAAADARVPTLAALADDLTAIIGNSGTAQAGVLLADALDRAEPGQTIALVVLADGATVLLFRTTGALAGRRPT